MLDHRAFPRLSAAACIAAALIVTGCSSSTNGAPRTATAPGAGSAATGAATTGSQPATASPAPDAAHLGARMLAAVDTLTSLHMTIGGTAVDGSGDAAMSHGKTTASDMTIDTAGIQVEVRTIGGKTWVKLPPAQRASGKPWTLVSATSTNPAIRAMASSMQTTQSMTSLSSFLALVRATTKFQVVGADTVNGAPATHYALTVDLTKVDFPGNLGQAIKQAHISAVPVDLWTDGHDRPVQVREDISAGGQSITIQIGMSDFDKPVTISAPPSDQVSTG